MFARNLVILSSLLALAACASVVKPKTIEGECRLFTDPGRRVEGKTREDQRWIDKTQETGIQICGWVRPKPETR